MPIVDGTRHRSTVQGTWWSGSTITSPQECKGSLPSPQHLILAGSSSRTTARAYLGRNRQIIRQARVEWRHDGRCRIKIRQIANNEAALRERMNKRSGVAPVRSARDRPRRARSYFGAASSFTPSTLCDLRGGQDRIGQRADRIDMDLHEIAIPHIDRRLASMADARWRAGC
jgi:hypothetical protein